MKINVETWQDGRLVNTEQREVPDLPVPEPDPVELLAAKVDAIADVLVDQKVVSRVVLDAKVAAKQPRH